MSGTVRFGAYEVDLAAGQLRKRGVKVPLRDQPFQVLASLLERPGEVVTREQLQRRLWSGDVFVDFENNLNTAVARLREALCDSADRPRYIETLPRRGYRFIGDVSAVEVAAAESKAGRARLVVLPFLNLSGDPSQEYFSDAITDEIITELASAAPAAFAVIARTTAMRYKGSNKDMARIGRELSVQYAVEGAVRRNQEHVTINVQLIQTSDQAHLFARKYEGPLSDMFRLQQSIGRDIVRHVNGAAAEVHGAPPPPGRSRPTDNLAAYNEYIQGRYLAERLTPEAMGTAKQHFEAAIALDPQFALAHVALADLYSLVGYVGHMRPRDAYSLGKPYAVRGAALDDSLAEAHAVLAEYHKQLDYNWPAAEREMAKALELSRASAFVRLRHAILILMPHNRIAEAQAEIEAALELDPLAGIARFWLGVILLLAQDYDRAIREARGLLELEPNSPWPHFVIGVAYRQKFFEGFIRQPNTLDASAAADLAENAITAHRKAIEISPASDVLVGWLGLALGVCGRKAEARAVLDQLHRSERYILPTSFGHVHLGLREFDAALEWFGRAVEERDQIMMPILSYAHFNVLRDDPRFAALLRKMNLEGESYANSGLKRSEGEKW